MVQLPGVEWVGGWVCGCGRWRGGSEGRDPGGTASSSGTWRPSSRPTPPSQPWWLSSVLGASLGVHQPKRMMHH